MILSAHLSVLLCFFTKPGCQSALTPRAVCVEDPLKTVSRCALFFTVNNLVEQSSKIVGM